jgi:uncharacterized protein
VQQLLETLARELVVEKERVRVDERSEAGELYLELRVARADRGRVIGRGGRTADALRDVLDLVAERRGLRCHMEVED